jgi:AraC-like DNA-binding protein
VVYELFRADWLLIQTFDCNFHSIFSLYWQLIYNWEAEHRIRHRRETAVLETDRLVLAQAQIHYDFKEIRPVQTLWFHFTCVPQLTAPQQVPLFLHPDAVELGLIQALAKQIKSRGEPKRQRIFGLSSALLSMVLSSKDLRGWKKPLPVFSGWWRRSKRTMRSRFTMTGSRGRAASCCAPSTACSGATRAFSAAQFVVQVREREREAAHVWVNTGLNLEEIAARTEFPDAGYFSRKLKQKTGQSPAQFRRLAPMANQSVITGITLAEMEEPT